MLQGINYTMYTAWTPQGRFDMILIYHKDAPLASC
jgi:hypothetical protein